MVKKILQKLKVLTTSSRTKRLELEIVELKKLQRGIPDPQVLFTQLSQAFTGVAYGPEDKYQDFRHVFLKDQQGQRVLYEVLEWAHVFAPIIVVDKQGRVDGSMTLYQDGERNIGLKLLSTLNAEPIAPDDLTVEVDNPEEGDEHYAA